MSDVHAAFFFFTLGVITCWLTLYLVGLYLSGAMRDPEQEAAEKRIRELAPLSGYGTAFDVIRLRSGRRPSTIRRNVR